MNKYCEDTRRNPRVVLAFAAGQIPNVYGTASIPIGTDTLQAEPNKARCLEVLKIFWLFSDNDFAVSGQDKITLAAQVSTVQLGAIGNIGDPRIIAIHGRKYQQVFSAGTAYATIDDVVMVTDLTDGAGNGILIASESLFLGVGSASYLQAPACAIRMLVRWKDISMAEYTQLKFSQTTLNSI